ncbi:MAG: tRNA (cytidine(34)-2'-O)-methyltransferase [Alphaproteobacteria bacterium]
MEIALYQPDIPQNLGAMMRLCACTNTGLNIIEPCGFPLDTRKIKQSALDYYDQITLKRYESWDSFLDFRQRQTPAPRIILMTTKASKAYVDVEFRPNDILLAGRESAGVPEDVHNLVDERICIPMETGFRSLNIVNATSMILGEALRQTKWQKND